MVEEHYANRRSDVDLDRNLVVVDLPAPSVGAQQALVDHRTHVQNQVELATLIVEVKSVEARNEICGNFEEGLIGDVDRPAVT